MLALQESIMTNTKNLLRSAAELTPMTENELREYASLLKDVHSRQNALSRKHHDLTFNKQVLPLPDLSLSPLSLDF